MSTYTNYNNEALDYDEARKPVGVDLVIDTVVRTTGKPLGQLHFLDAGCGTGQYSEALLKKGVQMITMMDASQGMLGVARNKVKPFIDEGRKVTIIQKILPDLPEGHFDVIMFNQVLHHVDRREEVLASGNGRKFPKIESCFRNAFQHLSAGGMLVVDNSTPHQRIESSWFMHLAPEAAQRFNDRFPKLPVLLRMLENEGFSDLKSVAFLSELMYREKHYRNLLGPLDERWRHCDSFWASLDIAETGEALEKVRELNQEGKLEEFFEQKEEIRFKYGQTTKTFAKRI